MNKNNQTISTKCQYQILASNPKLWFIDKWLNIWRQRDVIKNNVPTNTWNPWNPVII